MKRYEHKTVSWGNHTVEQIADKLGPEWIFVGMASNNKYAHGVWARELPSHSSEVLLMEISTQMHALCSEVVPASETLRLSALAECVDAIAKGIPVTMEDITGKPSN